MTWKNGARPSTRSPSRYGTAVANWQMLVIAARCVSWTTFGRPVVPLEDSSSATSSSARSIASRGAASRSVRSG